MDNDKETMGGMELLAIAEEIDSATSVLDMTNKAFQALSESKVLTGEETVLEISCGTGLFGFRLLEAKLAKMIAFADSEKFLLNICAKKAERAGLERDRVQIISSDLVSDPLPKEAFDVIVSVVTLVNVDDVGACMSNLHQALKPGGQLFLFELKEPLDLFQDNNDDDCCEEGEEEEEKDCCATTKRECSGGAQIDTTNMKSCCVESAVKVTGEILNLDALLRDFNFKDPQVKFEFDWHPEDCPTAKKVFSMRGTKQ